MIDTSTVQQSRFVGGRSDEYSGEQPGETMEFIAARLCGREVSSRQVGALGESYAAAWLERRSWRILDRNWHCRYGELDIVALSADGQIVFVEVKTRRGSRFGTPQEAVTPSKQANLRRAALQWLEESGSRLRRNGMRFDVVTVTVHDGQVAVHCIPGAF